MGTFSEIYLGIEAEARKNAEKNFFLDYKRESYRPIILYGAGGNCEFACFALLDIGGIKPTCICDTNRTGSYKYLEDSYAIITPSQLIENYSDAFVLITTWRYEKEIREQLCKMGVMDSQIYFLRWTKILPEKFKEQYLNEYQWAYEFFLDDISKQKVINRIKLHLLGTPCPADSLYKDGYFGYPGIRLEDNEIFVDGGAYIGDSVEEFIDAMDNRKKLYKYIYAFEPDSKNFIKAEERISVFKNVELVNYGLWSKKTELGFVNREFEEGIGSALTTHEGKGNTTVSVISLDAFFEDKPMEEWPTLIKMDIEGAEKEALLGAEKIIKEKKPKLIICAYHKPEDIYELPRTIMEMRNDYKFTLWQIGESFWDIILYAV